MPQANGGQTPSRKDTRQGRRREQEKEEKEQKDVVERSAPRTPVIYEVVRLHGEEEMSRPAISLWWSGMAAGLSISFSLLAQGVLQAHLPQAAWSSLVRDLG